jgi:hypothetical protein
VPLAERRDRPELESGVIQSSGWPLKTIDRTLVIGAPLVGLLILAALASGVLRSVASWPWNDARLARGIALWSGYRLYPGRDSRVPIIGTMHGPLPHLLYSCLAFLKDPTLLLIAACALSCVLYFGAVLWLHLRAEASVAGAYGFFACTALLLASRGASFSGFMVHVDACAMCCAMLAAGLLMQAGPPRAWTLSASAVLAVLAVASKQTMAPAAIALPCFVLMADGKRAFARYLVVQIAAVAAIFLAMLALFRPPRDLLFNTFTLAIRQPRTASAAARMMLGLSQVRSELAAAAAPLLVVIAVVALSPGSIREKIAKRRWLVFLWMALLQLPVELRAWSTDGGGSNHLGLVTLLVSLATTCGLVGLWRPNGIATINWTGLAARMLLIGILLVYIPLPFGIFRDLRLVHTSATQVAYNYERQHPGRAYFPINPLAALLAEGRLTHLDAALFDRELAGFPISAEQLAAGLPLGYQLVAYPPGKTPRAAILRELVKDKPRIVEPGLKGWRVYSLGPPVTQ